MATKITTKNETVGREGVAKIVGCEPVSVAHLQGLAKISEKVDGEQAWKVSDVEAWKAAREQKESAKKAAQAKAKAEREAKKEAEARAAEAREQKKAEQRVKIARHEPANEVIEQIKEQVAA